MAFLSKQPDAPKVADTSQVSSYKDPDPIPLGWAFDRYGSKWISDRWNITHVSAGDNKPDHIYCSIAARYCIGPIDYVGDVWKNDQRIASLNYTFGVGEESHTFTINANMKGGFNWTVTIHRGTSTATASATLIAGTGQNHPPYRGICWAEWTNLAQDDGVDAVPDMSIELGRKLPAVGSFTSGFSRSLGVNPVAAIYALLVETKGGIGMDTSLLDATHWAAQAQAMETSGIGQRTGSNTYLHPQFTQSQDAGAALSDLLAYFDGFIYFSGGKLKIGWFPNQSVDASGLPEIAEGDLEEKPSGDGFDDWNSGASSVALIFKNWSKFYNQDAAVFNAPANRRKVTTPDRKERLFLHEPGIAAIVAAELSVDVNPTDSGVNLQAFKSRAVDGGGAPLMPGSLFNWDYGPQSLDLVCRVTERRMRVGAASDILTVIRERGAFPRPYVPAEDDRVLPTEEAPGEITAADVRLWLLPYGLATDRELAVLVNRPVKSDAGAYVFMSPSGSSPWTQILDERFFVAKCAVVNTINSAAATVRVSTTSIEFAGFEAQDANAQKDDTLCLLIENELVSVSTITVVSAGVYDLGILRGRRGTSAASHTAAVSCWLFERSKLVSVSNAEFDNVLTAGVYDSALATKHFKVQLFNGDGDTGNAKPDDPGISFVFPDVCPPPSTLTLVSGNTTITTQPDTGEVTSRILASWTASTDATMQAHGNTRIQIELHTAGTWRDVALVPASQASIYITPVVNAQTYDVRIRNELGDYVSAWVTPAAGSITVTGDTTAPSAPTIAVVAYPGYNEITVTPSADADVKKGKFRYYYNTVNNSSTAALIANIKNAILDDAGRTPGAVAWYWAAEEDGSGNVGTKSAAVSVVTAASPVSDLTPGTPTAPTKAGEGTRLGGDGTVTSYIDLTVAAMAANTKWQNVRARVFGSTEWEIKAQLKNTGSVTVRLEDFAPGILYEFSIIGWWPGQSSAIVFAAADQLTGVTAAASTDIFTEAAHGMIDLQGWIFVSGTGFAPLVPGTTYYARDTTTTTFKGADTAGGAAKDITSNGTVGVILPNLLWTAPQGSAPAAVTGVNSSTAANDVARIPTGYAGAGGAKYQAAMLKWTKSTDPSVAYYEIQSTAAGSPTIWRTKGTETEFPYYSWAINVVAGENWKVRPVSRSGVQGAWVLSTTIPEALTANYGTQDMAEQAKNAVNITGGSGAFTGTVTHPYLEAGVTTAVDFIGVNARFLDASRVQRARIDNTNGDYYRQSIKLLGPPPTGWVAATGTASRATFATSTVTTAQLAQRVKALIDDLGMSTTNHNLLQP